jgi:hypothetical protein
MPRNSKGIKCSAVLPSGKPCDGRTRVVVVKRTTADTNLRRTRVCRSCGAVRDSVESWVAEPARKPKRRDRKSTW